MPGNAGALAHGSRMMGAMYDTTNSASGGLQTAQATLELWQGAGANAALATAVAIQNGLDQAQQSLVAARATMNWYSQEVDQDNLVLMQTEQQETQLQTEKAQDEKQMASLKAQLAQVEAQLAQAVVANQAAQAAASPLVAGGPVFPTGPAPAVHLIDTSQFTAQIDQLNQQISLLQFAIDTLDQKIQACESKKKEYEAKLKAASAKVTSEMQQAIALWPKAGLGSVNIQDATGCIAGYSPPPPSQPSFLDRFVRALPGAAAIVLTGVATLPLDATGSGEAIDGAVTTGVVASETADAGTTALSTARGLAGKYLSSPSSSIRSLATESAAWGVGSQAVKVKFRGLNLPSVSLVSPADWNYGDIAIATAAGGLAGATPGSSQWQWAFAGATMNAGQSINDHGSFSSTSVIEGAAGGLAGDAFQTHVVDPIAKKTAATALTAGAIKMYKP